MEDLGTFPAPVKWKLYSRRAEWADVVPIPSPDGNAVVAVQYKPSHADALGYFRAMLFSQELSVRVMGLTADMIGYNQSDYTAWACRWACAQVGGCRCWRLGLAHRY